MSEWEAVDYHNSNEIRCIRKDGKPIADVYNHFKNVEYNAQLIATAPELLDVAKDFKKYLNEFLECGQLNQAMYDNVEKVIAKVERRSNEKR